MSDYRDEWLTVLHGDVRERLRDLPDESVQCVMTSPQGRRDGTGAPADLTAIPFAPDGLWSEVAACG